MPEARFLEDLEVVGAELLTMLMQFLGVEMVEILPPMEQVVVLAGVVVVPLEVMVRVQHDQFVVLAVEVADRQQLQMLERVVWVELERGAAVVALHLMAQIEILEPVALEATVA